jgi:hypothetical protein
LYEEVPAGGTGTQVTGAQTVARVLICRDRGAGNGYFDFLTLDSDTHG